MPETLSYRTIMYSYRDNGEVIVHKFPYNANDKIGMMKLQKFVLRGFMFDDPRKKSIGAPEVIVTTQIGFNKPMEEGDALHPDESDMLPLEDSSSELATLTPVKDIIGELTTEDDNIPPMKLCPNCGKACKGGVGLKAHMRWCKSAKVS